MRMEGGRHCDASSPVNEVTIRTAFLANSTDNYILLGPMQYARLESSRVKRLLRTYLCLTSDSSLLRLDAVRSPFLQTTWQDPPSPISSDPIRSALSFICLYVTVRYLPRKRSKVVVLALCSFCRTHLGLPTLTWILSATWATLGGGFQGDFTEPHSSFSTNIQNPSLKPCPSISPSVVWVGPHKLADKMYGTTPRTIYRTVRGIRSRLMSFH